ncbi:DUF3068 domain-containing protein [Nocardioides sp. YIM 152588]|uniref:DUF3068 domain-containing protein n=1 Tax=Nocardioides sp. YIM 152588 TaxID=3158259 RepID=UPI0032E3E904
MSRKIGAGLVGLGVFLIVAAALMRFYAYPAMATVPTNYDSTTELEAKGAQVFNSDPSILAPEVVDLAIHSRTVADSRSDLPDDVVVWHNSVTIERGDGSVFQQSRERVAFDPVTAEAVDCEECDVWSEEAEGERVSIQPEGLVYKFPFNTEKKDYEQWDDTLGAATPIEYEGETTIDGLTVYTFVQTIEPTQVGTMEVPGSILGADEDSVEGEVWYGMKRTFQIEPVTGAPIDRVEERMQELRYDGVSVPLFTGTVEYTDDQVADVADEAGSNATMLGGMRMLFPLLALLLGIAALAGGLFLTRGSGGPKKGAEHAKSRDMVDA